MNISDLSLEIVRFVSTTPGPNLLVTGAIHGDEVCGPRAIAEAIRRFRSGKWKLAQGSITFIPVCNPRAHKLNRRFADINLNRVIKKHKTPRLYEEIIANLLTQEIDASDAYLDIHSMHTKGHPFVFQDYNDPATKGLAHALGFPHIVTGWPAMYQTKETQKLNAGDTTSYASHHSIPAVVIECGQHRDPVAKNFALTAIREAACLYGLLDLPQKTKKKKPLIVHGESIFLKKKEGSFVRAWKHLDRVIKGQVIATYNDGTTLTAPQKGFIILPFPKAPLGAEWFYFGTEEKA